MTLDVEFEKPITLEGNYDIKGKVMILPITGDGKSKISLGTQTSRFLKNVTYILILYR